MKIYTKKGDLGQTDLIGRRTIKSDILVDLVGEIDEAFVRIAFAKKEIDHIGIKTELSDINNCLFTISSIIVDVNQLLKLSIPLERVTHLEELIDQMDLEIPKLKAFITYDGCLGAIALSSLRSQIRNIERKINTVEMDKTVLAYLNRLSDYLFTAMRYVNFKAKISETKLNVIK